MAMALREGVTQQARARANKRAAGEEVGEVRIWERKESKRVGGHQSVRCETWRDVR